MSVEHLQSLRCVLCGREQPVGGAWTCPHCGLEGILDVQLDLAQVRKTLTPQALGERPLSAWRYQELLPTRPGLEPPLQLGWTPVYEAPRLAQALGVTRAWVKDEGRNPTASFKDRASAVGVVKALEAGARAIACASTGNAASSLAGFAASVGLPSFIFIPARTPEPKLAQLLIYGATVFRVQGSYEDAYGLCQDACARHGWYNRNCAVNPYLIEGKKTAGLELAEQLGAQLPDWVCMSVGDGCSIAGVWKGLVEMHALGFIPRLPRLLAVQSRGAAPLARAFEQGTEPTPMEAAVTLADSIAVARPRNARKALNAVRASKGIFVCVSDEELLAAMRTLARMSGVFAEPAAAAAAAGVVVAVREGKVRPSESVVIVSTGSGLKDTQSAIRAGDAPVDLDPEAHALDEALARQMEKVP